MPRRPRMISFRRLRGIFMRRAASTWVRPPGRRYSSSSISPGDVGGRFRSSTERGPLVVVVLADDGVSMALLPPERDPILLVQPHAEAPGAIALERLEAVAG